MPTHETLVRDDNLEPGSDRNFGLIVGGVLVVIGGYQSFTASAVYISFCLAGGWLVALALIAPQSLHGMNLLWTRLGELLGRVVTPVVMLIVYVITIVPIGLLLRVSGKELLTLRPRPDIRSYWIERHPPGPAPDTLKDQF